MEKVRVRERERKYEGEQKAKQEEKGSEKGKGKEEGEQKEMIYSFCKDERIGIGGRRTVEWDSRGK